MKPFWNAKINDFDVRVIDPRKIRFSKTSTKEEDSEFAIEEVTDTLTSVLRRFPAKKDDILKSCGMEDDEKALITNPEITYYEAWCWDYVIFKLKANNTILGTIRNPYWDWDGLLITNEEASQLATVEGDERRNIFSGIRAAQTERVAQKKSYEEKVKANDEAVKNGLPALENMDEPLTLSSYLFNHFDHPRKPYIFATIFNNENCPIGQTDMITQAIPLQENIDETKRDITQNAKLVNGIIKVDSTVMDKADAQRMRFETEGIIWGKGAVAGVQRETGPALPAFVVENMIDSRREIDDIMAASSAFKGIREGQETRGGRLALIDQSFLRLNELVQVIDYVNYELFNWFYQLAKVRYTEHHYAKSMGKNAAIELLTLVQDDFQDGSEVRIIAGKTLPPPDYFEAAGYDDPSGKAKNRVVYDMNKPFAVGIPDEELKKIAPKPVEEPPKLSIKYEDLPPDGKVQLAGKAGIILNPQIVVAEEIADRNAKKDEQKAKVELEHKKIEMKNMKPEPVAKK